MSEEEALKTIEELKNYISLEMIDINKPKELTDLFAKSMVAFQVMKNAYNKEKEKNKGLFEEYNKRVATIIKYEQEIKEIIDKIDVEDYYCLNEAEEDLRKLVE